MTVTNVAKSTEDLTMTISCEFDAPVERVWQVWADPRQLESWWGPPGYPGTFVDHDFAPGGKASYYLTHDGERLHGWWVFREIEAPHLVVLDDGFSDDEGVPRDDMPVHHITVELRERSGGGTIMVVITEFQSLEAMERMLETGAEEGFTTSLLQIEAVLAG